MGRLIALASGALSGAVFLGAGGRFAMYLFALARARPPLFSARGSLNVVLAGAIAGTIGGLILALTEPILPNAYWCGASSSRCSVTSLRCRDSVRQMGWSLGCLHRCSSHMGS